MDIDYKFDFKTDLIEGHAEITLITTNPSLVNVDMACEQIVSKILSVLGVHIDRVDLRGVSTNG